jgi:hypothetical protein
MLWLVACVGPETSKDAGANPLDDTAPVTDTDTTGVDDTAPLGPVLEVSASSVAFGAVLIGCSPEEVVHIENVGDADLEITERSLGGSADFGLGSGQPPWTLAPGESRDIHVTYVPLDAGDDEGTLTIRSSDPASPTVELPISGSGEVYGENVDTFVATSERALDLVIALDVSPSMADEQDALAAAAETLLDGLEASGTDWQLAVVTEDDGCVRDTPFITADTADALDQLQTWLLAPYDDQVLVNAGFSQLELALAADAVGSGGCNEGLLRDGAALALVGITDDQEQSPNPWSYYVSEFQDLPDDPDDLRIHALAGDYPSGCSGATPGTGWYEGSVATGGAFLSICADPDENLAALGEDAAGWDPAVYQLSSWPVEDTLTVTMDGVEVYGWTYGEADNEVTLDPAPPSGAAVAIDYVLLGDCD